jgi:hypothetical protein
MIDFNVVIPPKANSAFVKGAQTGQDRADSEIFSSQNLQHRKIGGDHRVAQGPADG